jgi:hypothetical protein
MAFSAVRVCAGDVIGRIAERTDEGINTGSQ